MKKKILNFYRNILIKVYLSGGNKKKIESYLQNFENSLQNPRKYYLQSFKYFHKFSKKKIKDHRIFFGEHKRGFGEDAFHVMWELLYNRFIFKNFVEIGVYRGQTISLLSLLAQINSNKINVYGISPFNNAGDNVSNYININFLDDTLLNFRHFNLDKPNLIKCYSTDQQAHDFMKTGLWDCVYIDGSHNYDIVKQDWEIASISVKLGGIIVFDDSSFFLNYSNPHMSFKGHKDPSMFVDELQSKSVNFKEILIVGHNRVFQRVK